ncbi:MAG: phosphoribosylglycinamide formyltransferase [Gemmatimonadaceae bacterium]
MSRARIGVLASGGGSNLQSILDHLRSLGESRGGDVVLVASNRPDAGALARAERAGVASVVLQSPHAPAGAEMADALRAHAVDVIALAGYMRHVPSEVTHAYHGRMVNVHPALLPSFGGPGMYGPRVHRAVIAANAPESGPTVHFVDEVYDHGAVILQWPVPVLPGDDAHALARRVLRAEHMLYPRVVDALAGGRVRLGADGRVEGHMTRARLATMDPALDDDELAATLDQALARALARAPTR